MRVINAITIYLLINNNYNLISDGRFRSISLAAVYKQRPFPLQQVLQKMRGPLPGLRSLQLYVGAQIPHQPLGKKPSIQLTDPGYGSYIDPEHQHAPTTIRLN